MHGVTLEAHSEGLGRGSEFVVRLPVALAVVPDGRTAAEGGDPADSQVHRRILVADDNEDSVSMMEMLLGSLGHHVRTANDGLEAVHQAAEFRPDVIILDIGMPRLNGYDAARKIREQPWGRNMVLVALTGWGQESDRARSREAGFDHHLVKPVEPATLERLLAETS